MATAVLMPRQGNTVETCLILEWKKEPGEKVRKEEAICSVETDKATFDVESPVEGVLLERFFEEGVDVPVLTNIAVIGNPGEAYDDLKPADGTVAGGPAERPGAAAERGPNADRSPAGSVKPDRTGDVATAEAVAQTSSPAAGGHRPFTGAISPRARRLAGGKGVVLDGLTGSGPGGRIIERDILQALRERPPLTPAAREAVQALGPAVVVPSVGSGIGGRVVAGDLRAGAATQTPDFAALPEDITEVQVRGVRKLISERMLASLQSTAQLTLNSSADAARLLAYRKKLKASPEDAGLRDVAINAIVLYATAKVLARYREINALYENERILQYGNVHLAFAVDTPRGLLVPVIRNAHRLSLKQIADESRRLGEAAAKGTVNPDDLQGGTFTVTNLGQQGIESFTPILNPPQVAILGVGSINLKPVQQHGEVVFVPHLGLSLTINHQVVDGGPAARFLQELSSWIAHIELLLAL